MAKIFNEVFTKPEFVMEDFLDHGYTSVRRSSSSSSQHIPLMLTFFPSLEQLFETEINRKIKHAPALNIDEVIAPFPVQHTTTPGKGDGADEDADVIPGDAVNDMWSFGVNVSA
jgi:U3 small nucleolar RNA-associated protein 19